MPDPFLKVRKNLVPAVVKLAPLAAVFPIELKFTVPVTISMPAVTGEVITVSKSLLNWITFSAVSVNTTVAGFESIIINAIILNDK